MVGTSRAERLVYLQYSPASRSRQILLLIGKHKWGSLDFDVCDRCARAHIDIFTLRAVIQNEGFEAEMLQLARAQVPDRYRWTYGAMAERADRFWVGDPRPLAAREPDELCEHLVDLREPGKLRDLRERLRYWRLTGQLLWPEWL
jgi:hypothetical protein